MSLGTEFPLYCANLNKFVSSLWSVCAIGQFVRPLTEIKPGEETKYRWMPLDESTLVETLFDVGQTVTFRAVYTGQVDQLIL